MHDEIIRFHLDGEIADDNVVEARERMIAFVENQMRDSGAVPSLDLEPQFTLDYQPDTERYKFDLTVYGIFVGGDEAWQGAGVTTGKMIPRSTPKYKSKES